MFDNSSGSISGYGMQGSGRKSNVAYINGAKKERRLNFSGIDIGEVEEYRIQVPGSHNEGWFEWWFSRSIGDRMVGVNGILGMVKYATAMPESKYIVDSE